MPDPLAPLLDALLYEGYALYPYTPGSTKNATPTPFGIVYAPSYAAQSATTHDRVELRCVLRAPVQAQLSAQARFLTLTGGPERAAEQSIELPPATVAQLLAGEPVTGAIELQGSGGRCLRARAALAARRTGEGVEVSLALANMTQAGVAADRSAALADALLSTHVLVRTDAGCFRSPLDCSCESTNTYPVLAGEDDRAVLGAAIVLPDHPQLAPESRGGLFDSTEIEEALLLHVLALSDAEREQIERADPVVRAMIARARSASPEDVLALHGRVTVKDCADPAASAAPRAPGAAAARRDPITLEPPQEPAGLPDPTAGEATATVDGVTFRRGGRVRIAPGPGADVQARMLDGRSARIERILTDYDGRVHVGVTVDGDPGQELMSETGRFLYFFAPELEVIL